MKIKAEIVADSINIQKDRITTMLVTFPRFLLAELNTHRMFSKNSASSRAIPFEKMVKSVEENPFIPIAWQKDHKGMQGTEYITDDIHKSLCKNEWLCAKNMAVESATDLHNGWVINDETHGGITKQLCNRLLEPFMWHTVLITATEWENFFVLRCPKYIFQKDEICNSKKDFCKRWKIEYNEDIDWNISKDYLCWASNNEGQSEIHMMALAEAMWDCYNESVPRHLNYDEWHIPFENNLNNFHFTDFKMNLWKNKQAPANGHYDLLTKIAIAKCARISYTVVGEEDKEINYDNDLKLYNKLLESGHLSPFEHCAKAMTKKEYESYYKGILTDFSNTKLENSYVPVFSDGFGWCNNFKGFIQYRKLIDKI